MPVNFLEKDFEDLKEFLIKKRLISENEDKGILTNLKHIHKVCYSFALWDHNLARIPYNGKVFLKEIRSDAIQSIPLLLLGFKKPVSILLRGIIENSLKHIYFIDHPVEFEWLTTKSKYFPTMNDLYDYTISHPSLKSVFEKIDIVDVLKQKYIKSSMLVHSRDVSHMQLVKSLSGIKRDEGFITDYKSDLIDIGNVINLMFGLVHKERFNKFNQFSQEIILNCMNRKTRRIFHGI